MVPGIGNLMMYKRCGFGMVIRRNFSQKEKKRKMVIA
jgi:hypothetical protein